jgi:GLPGLI family protein
MKTFLITISLICLAFMAEAQQIFIKKGKIEYEKTINLYKQQMENREDNEDENSWLLAIFKSAPKTVTNYFDLYFDNEKMLYQPGKDGPTTASRVPDWMLGPANENIVFTDLINKTFTSQKTVFESTFNITDSIRKMEWKISPDTRNIAGFECRKATTIIMDSVYVVAFYTDQIVTSGGPESFNGLPGMILGLAIPRMHITWFATKLELVEIKDNTLVPPKRGKKTNVSNLKSQLKESMKDWGKWGHKNTWQIMI